MNQITETTFLKGKKHMELIRGKVVTPYKICLYGQGGVGKSTLASIAENAVFFDIESGLDQIDCDRTPLIKTSKELSGYVRELIQTNQGKTFIFDSCDALEKIFVDEICKKNKIESLSDLGYGKGYEELNSNWNKFLDMLDWLKGAGKNTIVIGHEVIKKYENPMADPYDKILLKMHQKSAGTLISRMDAVLYMNYEVTVVKGDNKKGEKTRAFGKGERVLHCCERPAFIAKNRYNMPERINPQDLFNYLPKG